jgi:predicted nucleic acid-binding protein
MSTVFADTFYLLGLANPDDHAHEKCQEFARHFNGHLVTTVAVLMELADALATSSQRGLTAPFIQAMENDNRVKILPLTHDLFERGLEHSSRHSDKTWSLTDCISFVVMRDEGIAEAVTGDHDFEQAGFKIFLK